MQNGKKYINELKVYLPGKSFVVTRGESSPDLRQKTTGGHPLACIPLGPKGDITSFIPLWRGWQ